MRNISYALTEQQFLAGSKDVTRRMGWKNLNPGDRLCAVRKGMGLKKGEKIVRLGVIEVVSVRREILSWITECDEYLGRECAREGFPDMTPEQFVNFFCESHPGCTPETVVTRIEFKRVSP